MPGSPENRGNTEILCFFTVLKIETPEEPEVWTLYYIYIKGLFFRHELRIWGYNLKLYTNGVIEYGYSFSLWELSFLRMTC